MTADSERCVVINKFAVPAGAQDAFLAEFGEHRSFLATQPGFVEGAIYTKTGGPGRFNVVNIAAWESIEAVNAAREAMGAHYASSGRNPGEVYDRLGVEADIATYVTLERY